MNIEELPKIYFGRSRTTTSEDCYHVWEPSPEIPEEAVRLFKNKLTKSIQWNASESSSNYPDCFLFWRLESEAFYVARLSDEGKDTLGRPHTLKITAYYVAPCSLSNESFDKESLEQWVISCLCVDENKESCKRELAEPLSKFLAGNVKTFLLTSHPHFLSKAFDLICHLPNNVNQK